MAEWVKREHGKAEIDRSGQALIPWWIKWLLLVLDTQANTVKVRGYTNQREASQEIAKIEQAKHPELDAVLVWVRSVKDLRAAYPNYYADTRDFLGALDSALRR